MYDNGKRELIYFLQSRTKGVAVSVRAIDKIQEQKHKRDSFARIVKTIMLCDLGSTLTL